MSLHDSRPNHDQCPVIQTLDQIGSKWRLVVIWGLEDGELRFNELKRTTGANSQTLSRVLDDLEASGFVDRRVDGDGAVSVHYSLTEKGIELLPLFKDIEVWADRWLIGPESP